MSRPQFSKRASLLSSVAVVGTLVATVVVALSATDASAWQNPLKHRYLTKPLNVCDQGVFYVGGAPKISPFHNSATPGPNRQLIIGQMYVQFQIPMVSKSWPLIMVHGSGYTGACVQGTAGGNEGWSDYAVRNGVPTFVVDQSGRARSGFDKTVLHEAEHLIDIADYAGAKALIPTIGGNWGSNAWTNWFGHIINGPDTNDVTLGQMVRHGAAGDPLCATEPAHCNQLGRLPMEPEAPWAVDQAIKSRTGNGAPAGLGTVTPDNAQVAANAAYLALDAYKFDVPNMETTLPRGACPTCTLPPGQTDLPPTSIWTPKALAELIEGLGGAILATHSQSGIMGHDTARYLKAHGKLGLLKGLITIEGSCNLALAGVTAADFASNKIPYMAFKGDYTNFSQLCQDSVNAINAAGGKAEYVQLDQPGWWQGSYAGPFGAGYVGPFAGVSHMMMIEDNPAPGGKATNLQVMDVLLGWADRNISKPKTATCGQSNNI